MSYKTGLINKKIGRLSRRRLSVQTGGERLNKNNYVGFDPTTTCHCPCLERTRAASPRSRVSTRLPPILHGDGDS